MARHARGSLLGADVVVAGAGHSRLIAVVKPFEEGTSMTMWLGVEPPLAQSRLNRPAPGYSQYGMPVDGLYQTGAITHPGGSVSGRPRRSAARVMLEDLGVDPATEMT